VEIIEKIIVSYYSTQQIYSTYIGLMLFNIPQRYNARSYLYELSVVFWVSVLL